MIDRFITEVIKRLELSESSISQLKLKFETIFVGLNSG
jgi:hypothetical protein